MKIGHGYDVHAFEEGRKLILGGVSIPHTRGLAGHSDADAVIHAVCDALLGAAGLGDIGHFFPDTDDQFKDINSRILLQKVAGFLSEQNSRLINADITIIAQAPKLANYISAMKENLAQDLVVKADQINIKATTTEKLGYIGREEGIAVHAVVLLTSDT